jgi:hypothetical protein
VTWQKPALRQQVEGKDRPTGFTSFKQKTDIR